MSVQPGRRCVALIGSVLFLAVACSAGWHTITPTVARPIPPRQQVQLWIQGRMLRVHAVRFGSDSVRAIPFLLPIDCDTCRVAFPRDQVDSVRVGDPVGALGATVLLALVGLVILAIRTGGLDGGAT